MCISLSGTGARTRTPKQLAERVCFTIWINWIPVLTTPKYLFMFVSVGSSPHSFSCTSAPVQIPVYIATKSDTETSASSTGFPSRAKWGMGNSRACEKRKGGIMGTSIECERGVMGRELGERGESLLNSITPSITPFVPAFLK